ncbi:hypothetical protein ACFQX4_03060 [Roseomonas sp. GCM10028921]
MQAEGSGVLMWHESALVLRPVPGLRIAAGTIRYEYRATAADPVLRLTVTLRAGQKVGLTDLRLTTALDALSEGAAPPAHLSVGRGGTQSRRPAGPFAEEVLSTGPTDCLHLWSAGPEEEALALRIRPRAGEAVFNLRLQSWGGVPHWLVLRHTLPDLPRGGTATLREDRLLARGVAPGTPEVALRVLRAPEALSGRDPGQTGPGAPLAAMASVLLNAPGFAQPLPRERLARLREVLERQLAALPDEEGEVLPVAELAPVAVALDVVWRAGGSPRDRRRLRQVLGQLTAAASADGVIGTGLAEHGAVMLALARGASLIPEPWVPEALGRAVLALDPAGLSLPGLDGAQPVPARALAALLRGLRAVEVLAGTGRVALEAEVLARAAAARDACLQGLAARLRSQEDRLEVLPGGVGEPDAASTAALLLGVLSPDEVAFSAGDVAA